MKKRHFAVAESCFDRRDNRNLYNPYAPYNYMGEELKRKRKGRSKQERRTEKMEKIGRKETNWKIEVQLVMKTQYSDQARDKIYNALKEAGIKPDILAVEKSELVRTEIVE